jgi:hypothetical protein
VLHLYRHLPAGFPTHVDLERGSQPAESRMRALAGWVPLSGAWNYAAPAEIR